MKNILIISFLILTACSSSKQLNPQEDNKALEAGIKEFKIVFFERCVGRSYRKKCKVSADNVDLSYSHDFGLGLYNYQLVDSLSTMVAQRIIADSIAWTNQVCNGCDEDKELLQRMKNNGMIGKRTLKFCLDYYTSHELDSIARINMEKRLSYWKNYKSGK